MTAEILLTVAAAAVLSGMLIILMMPLLRRYAQARPNARSSHATPTPQGAGLAVLSGACMAALGFFLARNPGAMGDAGIVMAAAYLLAATGAWDDLRPLGPLPKLVTQVVAVAAVICFATPPEARLFPALPLVVERALSTVAGVWFVNLVNFMDGIDWMTVIGCGVPLAALALLGSGEAGGEYWSPMLAALCGALIGFAPFNRPVATVFLGDVGSLPVGLILGYGLYRLALSGHLAAAVILPLYYLWDSGSTLARRLLRGEAFWRAHRDHVYQRAADAGWSTSGVIGQILLLNLCLAGLAFISAWWNMIAVSSLALIAAGALVAFACRRLVAGPPRPRGTAA
jgi:UDP-N-acetylmuramyl pentapeptide phosphotransferase/UDP-N-acetylglucosamine-1-phosphate transferase